jgi:hypothetical protein
MDKEKKKGFTNPILPQERDTQMTAFQKELLKKKFIEGAPGAVSDDDQTAIERDTNRTTVTMRVPRYYVEDLNKIQKLTGQTKNAIYIDILRNAIKLKLKELQEK